MLSKPRSEVSESDVQQILKKIGEVDPYPMMALGHIQGEDGSKALTRFLGVLESALTVVSERDVDEIEGMAIREMPTPDMLPMFFEVINALHPDNKRRSLMILGEPGSGKTYMGELSGRLGSEAGGITVDCTGLPLVELFYETVLDFSKGDRFYDALEGKIAQYNDHIDEPELREKALHSHSVSTLRESLGEAFIEDEKGRISIDWDRVKSAHKGVNVDAIDYLDELKTSVAEHNRKVADKSSSSSHLAADVLEDLEALPHGGFSKDEDGTIHMNWAAAKEFLSEEKQYVYLTSEESTARALKGLRTVSENEGLNSSGGNALGMATQPGVAWRAHEEGRVLILDELNRAKRGTFGILHRWFQFVIGEIDECTVRNPMQEKGDVFNEHLVFKRSEMGLGHFVFMTGNLTADSDEVADLPEALSSRIVPKHVPDSSVRAWQHRFCQMLTGLPVSTLYDARADYWADHEDEFGEKLMEWRLKGEKREVPESQKGFIKRWKDVYEATGNLATFLNASAHIINPDSDWYTQADSLKTLLSEIDDSFKKETSVDFRKISYLLNKAREPKPHVRPPSGADFPKIVPLIDEDHAAQGADAEDDMHLGSYLSYAIVNWIYEISYDRGKTGLGNQLLKTAYDCGIIPPQLNEAQPSPRRFLADLLDDNPYSTQDHDAHMRWTRDICCKLLRERHAEDHFTDNNDEIIPLSVLERSMDDLSLEKDDFVIFNLDKETIVDSPISVVKHEDSAKYLVSGERVELPANENVLHQSDFLNALPIREARGHNLSALFTDSLSRSGSVTPGLEALVSQAVLVAENSNTVNVAATTLNLRQDNGEVSPVHVVWNKRTDKVVVVGDGAVSGALSSAFNHSKVSYVDRNADLADKRLYQTLVDVVEQEVELDSVYRALSLRSSSAEAAKVEGDSGKRLVSLMLDKDLDTHAPQFLVTQGMSPAGM